ncbi:MAG: type II toxin-antitoxin system VapC family toxin [Gammaproteobacteria bacterium]
MRLVIDASMALAWIFERNNNKEARLAEFTLSSIARVDAIVPTLWHTEVVNALLVGERRKIVTEAQVIDYLNRLSHLPIETDDVTPSSCRDSVMALAREHALTAYDSTYLELALRNNATLATFDNKLIEAMNNIGGKIFTTKYNVES